MAQKQLNRIRSESECKPQEFDLHSVNGGSYTLYLPSTLRMSTRGSGDDANLDDDSGRSGDDDTTCTGFETAAGDNADDAASHFISCNDTVSTISAPSQAFMSQRGPTFVIGETAIPTSIQVGNNNKSIIKKDRNVI